MICNKCNHKLPDDSEFCQYCGNKIEKEVILEGAPVLDDNQDETIVEDTSVSSDDILKEIMMEQARTTIRTMEANRAGQAEHEGEADFGLVPEKPIYTLATDIVEGEHEYLDSLRVASSGEKIKWERSGSVSAEGIHGIIDMYDTYLPSGEFYKTVYINMYGAKKSLSAPVGFFIANNVVDIPNKKVKTKKMKTKFCSRCGSLLDNQTKQCKGCGKKYFKGIRFNKVFFIILSFSLVLLAAIGFIAYQYNEIDSLEEKTVSLNSQITSLKTQISTLNSQISTLKSQKSNLEKKVDDLEDEAVDLRVDNLLAKWDLDFYEKYVAIVTDGSKKYHVYGCDDLDTSSFRIYNTKQAENLGYYACSKCH